MPFNRRSSIAGIELVPPAAPLPRSPERIALAEAIERHAGATSALAHVETALRTAGETRRAAKAALERAGGAIEQARADATTAALAAARGEKPAPAMTVREARAAQQAAEDDVETAAQVETALKDEHADASEALRRATNALDRAVFDAFKADAKLLWLVTHLDDLREQVKRCEVILSSLPYEAVGDAWDVRSWFGGPRLVKPEPDRSADIAKWSNALTALRTDPDFILPVID